MFVKSNKLFLMVFMLITSYNAIAKEHGKQNEIIISKNNFGPITTTTKYNQNALQKLFPQNQVRTNTLNDYKYPINVLEVLGGGTPIITIMDQGVFDFKNNQAVTGKILSVSSSSKLLVVQEKNGILIRDVIGKKFSELTKQLNLECLPSFGETAPRLITCRAVGGSNVFYKFKALKGDQIGVIVLPAKDKIRNLVVAEVFWYPQKLPDLSIMGIGYEVVK